jgi:predicted nuclease of predicted toxin-antitoxin system
VKILMDTCVWGGNRNEFSSAGHDVVWASDWPKDPGDKEILSRAYKERRVLITLDKDFGELAIVQNQPNCGIIRLVELASRYQVVVCLEVLKKHSRDLGKGAIITATRDRIRIRLSEQDR